MRGVPHPASIRRPELVLIAVGGLGFAAVTTQLTLLRELLGAFSGNELVLGLALGSWLLLTGAGAWLGAFARHSPAPERTFAAGMLGVAVLPLAQLLALRAGREVFLPHGATAGVGATALGCIATLLPFCVVSGALLTLACVGLERAGHGGAPGRVYVADTVGSLIGGAVFTFVLVGRLDHCVLLVGPALLSLALASALALRHNARWLLAAATLVAAGLLTTLAWDGLDARSSQWQHRGEIVFRATSPYGRLVVTRDASQLTFFENGVPILHTENRAAIEEAAHYAMAQRPAARRILLISGGVAGTAREILRHNGAEVTCVELDPGVLAAGRRLLPENLADPRLSLVATDGRRFLQHATPPFDVIILDLPDPTTLQLNRFFTTEFFATAKRALTPGGVLSFGLGRYQNYLSPELARLLASAHHTLGSAFAHVRLIPGGRVYFLGSDAPLHLDIADRLEQRGVKALWVNRHYLDTALAPDRLAVLTRAVAQPAARNTDFAPVLYYYQLRHWLGQFTAPHSLPGLVLLAALAVYLLRLRPVPRAVFAAGFAASALELVALLAYQVFYGSLYQQVGLVVTVFMTGLASGAAWTARSSVPVRPQRTTAALGFGIAALAGALPFLLAPLGGLDATLGTELAGQATILLLTFTLAALVGAQFPLAAAAGPADAGTQAARLFSADLLGAALGALLVSAWLLPLLGMTAVCLLTAALNVVTAALAWRSSPGA